MDKLETAKQAAREAAWKEAYNTWIHNLPPVEKMGAVSSGPSFYAGYESGFDAGVACQGEWTAVEDGLPRMKNNSCNRHLDCDAKPEGSGCCYVRDCKDCFGI